MEHAKDEAARVLARVRKMLALANDAAATEGERDNAMRMAHATLAKHNLSMAEAELSGAVQEEGRAQEEFSSRRQPWVMRVCNSVAVLFFCQYVVDNMSLGRGRSKHMFVGRVANATTASLVAEYVVKSIMKEANKLWRLQPDPGPWWTSFCKGASMRISERCHELRRSQEDQSASGNGRSVVLASFYDEEARKNKEWLSTRMRTTQVRTKESDVGAGYDSGRSFGDSINLSRQIGGSQKSTGALLK